MNKMNLEEFVSRYCAKQKQTPIGLINRLKEQKAKWNPEGWMLLECAMLDSVRFGQLCILPYGPNNSLKTVPDHPFSPRGLASDQSIVIGVLEAGQIKLKGETDERKTS
jgi:hypothetical protein